MQQRTAQEIFLNSSFSSIEAHDYEPFRRGHLDVRLPVPNSDIRLFIFCPADYPYLWTKYLEGLQREYARIGVDDILDMQTLNNPESAAMGVLAIIDGEIVSGMRFHRPLRKVEEASVYSEMAEGNQAMLKQLLEAWIPEKVVEAKGLWLVTKHPARKRILHSMARSSIYGSVLLGARFIPGTSPANVMKLHVEIGMQEVTDIGCVPYPNKDFKTTFGFYDTHHIIDNCTDQNRILLRRDWQKIQQARLQSEQQRNDENSWLPVILDVANPFHAQALESLLMSAEYEQRKNFKSMQDELSELIPPIDEALKTESKRWIAYPWRKVALELVGPRTFSRLLKDRNRNKITAREQETLATLSVGVVGLSTGHVIAHTMVMEGVCGHIKLADFDTLEVSNMNRIPASLLDIGTNKAIITARRIAELDPYLSVEVYDEGLQASNIDSFMNGLDIIVEECDSLDVKVLVREAAIKRKIPVLMSTSDLGMMDIERFDLDEDPKPFHGLANIKASQLKDLSRTEKSGYALAIVEGEKISSRLAASMLEINHTVSTWAQLASDVTQGAALVTTAVRRIGTGKVTPSSRTRMNMDQVLMHGVPPVVNTPEVLAQPSALKFTGIFRDDMVLAASFAPSLGNSQPWDIKWVKDKFQLKINRDSAAHIDIKSRASLVALGAASFNAEVVAAHYDEQWLIEQFPLKRSPDLVTRLSPNEAGNIDTSLGGFYPSLLKRKTNRLMGDMTPLSVANMTQLSEVTKRYPVKLHMLSQAELLGRYADIVSESDRLRYLNEHLHQEMTEELVWPSGEKIEKGVDVRTLGLMENDLNSLSILKRADVMKELAGWGAGHALGDYNKSRITSASAIVVLTINGESEQDYVTGGKAMQHFWMIAEQLNLAVQPIAPLFLYANDAADINTLVNDEYQDSVASLQQRFNTLFNIDEGEFPVVAFRLSFAPEPEFRSLRRA